MSYLTALSADAETRRRVSIGFNNFAHAVDHYVMLIFPTVVIGLMVIYGKTYAELIALGTASFFAFGLFSLPAGWLADRWSRRNMMAVFYIGCGVSLAGAALAPNLIMLGVALFALGMFAAIYHPVGTAIVVSEAVNRGRTLAFNGVCGNLGVAFAAGITAIADRMDRLARRVPDPRRDLHRHRHRLSHDGAGRPPQDRRRAAPRPTCGWRSG